METAFIQELIKRMEKETQEIEAQIQNFKKPDDDMMTLFLAGKLMSHQCLIRELQHIFRQNEKPIITLHQ